MARKDYLRLILLGDSKWVRVAMPNSKYVGADVSCVSENTGVGWSICSNHA